MADVSSRDRLLQLVWDLRDEAYDNPEPWARVSAQDFLQALAETVENEEVRLDGQVVAWEDFGLLLRRVADHMNDPLGRRDA